MILHTEVTEVGRIRVLAVPF